MLRFAFGARAGKYLTLALVCGGVLPAQAETQVTLTTPTLERQSVELVSLIDGTLSFYNDQGLLQQHGESGFVRLELGQAEPEGGYLELVDGQRLAGEMIGGTPDGQAVSWLHPLAGDVELPLERLRVMVLNPELDPATLGSMDEVFEDRLVLGNGDVLTGYLEAVDQAVLRFVPTGEDSAWEMPVERVAAVMLANPLPEPNTLDDAAPYRVTLVDGTQMLAGRVTLRENGAWLESWLMRADATSDARTTGWPLELPLGALASVELRVSGYRLMPVSAFAWDVVSGGEAFGLPYPPAVDGPGLTMHAPVSLVIDLPEDAERWQITAALDSRGVSPEAMAKWANVVLRVQGPDPGVYTLDQDTPRVTHQSVAEGADLMLSLEPGVNGPVLDRVRLIGEVLLPNAQAVSPSAMP